MLNIIANFPVAVLKIWVLPAHNSKTGGSSLRHPPQNPANPANPVEQLAPAEELLLQPHPEEVRRLAGGQYPVVAVLLERHRRGPVADRLRADDRSRKPTGFAMII